MRVEECEKEESKTGHSNMARDGKLGVTKIMDTLKENREYLMVTLNDLLYGTTMHIPHCDLQNSYKNIPHITTPHICS